MKEPPRVVSHIETRARRRERRQIEKINAQEEQRRQLMRARPPEGAVCPMQGQGVHLPLRVIAKRGTMWRLMCTVCGEHFNYDEDSHTTFRAQAQDVVEKELRRGNDSWADRPMSEDVPKPFITKVLEWFGIS